METSSAEANEESAPYDKFQTTKNDAETLLKRNDSYMDVRCSQYGHKFIKLYLTFFLFSSQMEDQDGNIIHLPPKEKRALLMALAMHEKGRSALKREDFNEALVLLLDADREYKTCNSQMLESVDNYALLNLDIVWCYLMLKVSEGDNTFNRFNKLYNSLDFRFRFYSECDPIAGRDKTFENLRTKF